MKTAVLCFAFVALLFLSQQSDALVFRHSKGRTRKTQTLETEKPSTPSTTTEDSQESGEESQARETVEELPDEDDDDELIASTPTITRIRLRGRMCVRVCVRGRCYIRCWRY
ncbi:unnamed protein product [Echinostoma caproni]|uniref:Defensin_propep domain-containing protein n=1 Tax=Echinostoma caproni TaxID=27848 RepID=A0A183AMB9_9TREM|nr:unnamed protein product [Echinostoma caproni]